MLHLSENLRKYRVLKNLTQEDVAEYLMITPQSVSKWERGESYPDITLLPALANIFETSIDLLVGMDMIRAEATRYNIHKRAVEYQRKGDYDSVEKTYRDALLIYPNKPEMILGLASTLALKGSTNEAIVFTEKGLSISINEKQKATMRATLCFLYLKAGYEDKANRLASELPHIRESREVIQPLIQQNLTESEINQNIKGILLGDEEITDVKMIDSPTKKSEPLDGFEPPTEKVVQLY